MFFTTFIKEKFWIIVFFLALVYFVVLIRNDMVQNNILKKEKETATKSISVELSRQAELRHKLRILNKMSYVEELAREKLGVIHRGERAYKVIIK